MTDEAYIRELVDNSRLALKEIESFSQKTIDKIVREIAKYVFDNTEELAVMSVEETGITKIAKPIGVVGAIQPTTNPQVTPMANAMSAIKGRNSIIIAPHPRAEKTTKYLVDRWNEALKKLGAPDNLIQYVNGASVERTNLLMKYTDVIVATGGPGMVKAAYSSGKPSFGVGQGNVQTIIDRDVDIKEAIKMIVDGRIFDRGIICSGEQSIITPVEKYEEMRKELEAYGGYWIDHEEDRIKLLEVLFSDGKTNKEMVGQSVDVITPFKYNEFSEAVDIAIENLEIEGKGHSVSIHSNNEEHIRELGMRVPVSRVLVNQTCATSSGGSFQNGLNPSSTLGCGSRGENLSKSG